MDVTTRVSAALACAALDPQLSGVLLLDSDPGLVFPLAQWLATLLADESRVVSLGPKMAEDTLWQRIVPNRDRMGFRPFAGPLAGYDQPRIVLVPDLTLLSLPAARAAVTTIGADVVHLERSGESERWRPRDRWIAVLRRQDAGKVSPHLLDRFAVRVDARDLTLPGNGNRDVRPALPPPSQRWEAAVRAGRLPGFSAEAAERVLAFVPAGTPGVRRELALGRLARALAGLAGAAVVRAAHVDDAAELTGYAASPEAAEAASVADPGSSPVEAAPDETEPVPTHTVRGTIGVLTAAEQEPVLPEPGTETAPAGDEPPGMAADGPYPEDRAEPWRVADSLRIPWRPALSGPPRGHPIGSQRARDVRDIAVVATLLQAAKFQAVRCRLGPLAHYLDGHALHLSGADLLSYRRAPQPGCLLVLVLDHTCRVPEWDWYQPLAPYLRWAYASRAPVGVVEVGSADAASELRAEQFRSRSLLDPRVAAALERAPGRATPLAHGLSLAARILRHDTQQGSVPVDEAVLVVVTDGRGNVPLAASQTAETPVHAGQAGVMDALECARLITGLHRVRSLVIAPGQRPYGHLATLLGEALSAPVVRGGADHGAA